MASRKWNNYSVQLASRISSLALSKDHSKFFISDVLDNQALITLHNFNKIHSLDYLQRFRQFRNAYFVQDGILITSDSKAQIGKWHLHQEKEVASTSIMALHFGSTTLDMASQEQSLVTISSDGFLQHWQMTLVKNNVLIASHKLAFSLCQD